MTLGGSGWKSSQKYPVNAGVHQGSIVGPTLSYFTLVNFLMMLSNIAIFADDTTVIRHVISGNN